MVHFPFEDLSYGLRMMRKDIGSTSVIVLSLAIGIGANSAIFSVVNALLLRPLPYPEPERLAAVWLHSPGIGIFRDWPSPGQYVDIRNENHSFDRMALAQSRSLALTGREKPERIDGMRTQSSLLSCSARTRISIACCFPKMTNRASRSSLFSRTGSGSGYSAPIPQLLARASC
jgi:hypothetical protein